MARDSIKIDFLIEYLLDECTESTQHTILIELLQKYGNEDLCLEAFGNSLLDQFSEITVVNHFNLELKVEE